MLRGLSLPMQVSTTMRRPSDSMTKAWIAPMLRPSSVTKCGFSQACCSSRSGVASANRNVPGDGPSISITRAIVTAPIFHRLTG